MGIIQSRRPRTPVATASNSCSYKYPPKSENYFSSHFIMGGERFESSKPDAYLFGENEDLNFLGSKPTPFPYPVPQPHEPTKTLRSLVNIRKDSLRFVKDVDENNASRTRYNIEFTFDTDVKCAITIFYFAKEEISNKQAIYHPRDLAMNSDTFHYKRGANQTFCQPTHFIDPTQFPEDDWKYNPDTEVIPVVIQCVVEETEYLGHSHMTFAVVERSLDGGFSLKPLKQKLMVDGLCYLLQEIYGIENKNAQRARDDDVEDNGSECVICMCEMRDTLILPCRHLCLCNSCADNLRYQANNCPICRAKFHALLQIKAMRKKPTHPPASRAVQNESEDPPINQDGIPAGYEAVSLIEALNGPTQPHCACSVPTPIPTDATVQSLSSNTTAATPSSDTSQLVADGAVVEKLLKEAEENCSPANKDTKKGPKCSEDALPLPVHTPSEDESACYEMAIQISDEEEEEEEDEEEENCIERTTSTHVTPLHEARVALTTQPEKDAAAAAAAADVNLGNPAEEGRLQIMMAVTDDSRYSSSPSSKDLLEHGPDDSMDDGEDRATVGCTEDVNVSIV